MAMTIMFVALSLGPIDPCNLITRKLQKRSVGDEKEALSFDQWRHELRCSRAASKEVEAGWSGSSRQTSGRSAG